MSYNPETTRIFYENENKNIIMCIPTGELPVEIVAVRDLPKGSPYWIVETKPTDFNIDMQFIDAYELDEDSLGAPHGVALGYEEWARQQPLGTPGL